MEQMEVEAKSYTDASEGTLLSWISAYGSDKPVLTNADKDHISPSTCHCPYNNCCTKTTPNCTVDMETDNCVTDLSTETNTVVKETQTVLTLCPNFDIYSCPCVTEQDKNAFQLSQLLETLHSNNIIQNSECDTEPSAPKYDSKTLHLIREMCSAESVPILVSHKCNVLNFCYEVVDGEVESDRKLLMACVHILEVTIQHDQEVCKMVVDTRQSLHLKLCLLFDATENHKDKQCLLELFKHIIKHALTIDDEIFEQMVYRSCSVLNSMNESLLQEGVFLLDLAVELYQEWDIHTMLLNYGVFPTIVSFVNHSNYEIKIKALRIVGNLLSLAHLNINWAVIKGGIMSQLVPLLLSDDAEIVKQCLWVLSNVTAGPKGARKTMYQYGLIPAVLQHIQSGCPPVAIEALFVLANLIEDASPKMRTDLMQDKQILSALVFCLKADKSCMQPDDMPGMCYLELLRDTFKTINKCLKPKEDGEESNSWPSDSDSEYEAGKESDDDEDDSAKPFHYLNEEEKLKVLRYLDKEHDICTHLKAICERKYEDSQTAVIEAMENILVEFKIIVSKSIVPEEW